MIDQEASSLIGRDNYMNREGSENKYKGGLRWSLGKSPICPRTDSISFFFFFFIFKLYIIVLVLPNHKILYSVFPLLFPLSSCLPS